MSSLGHSVQKIGGKKVVDSHAVVYRDTFGETERNILSWSTEKPCETYHRRVGWEDSLSPGALPDH